MKKSSKNSYSINKKILSIIVLALAILLIPIIKNVSILKTDVRETRNSMKPAYDETKKKKSKRVLVNAKDVHFRSDFDKDIINIRKKYPDPREFKEKLEQEIGFNFPITTITNYPISETTGKTLAGSSTEQWEHTGPTGVGVITAVDYYQKDYKNLLLGTEESGLYKSSDFGKNWEKIIFPANHINEVAINPEDNKHYLVLTNKIFLYETKNAGKSWKLIHTFKDTKNYYQGSQNSDFFWNKKNIFLRVDNQAIISENNGKKWTSYDLPSIKEEKNESIFRNTKIKINGHGIHAVNTIKQDNLNQTYINKNYIYKTSDYGKTWINIINQADGQVNGFDISQDGKTIVYIKEIENSSESNTITINTSKDEGKNWKEETTSIINEAGYPLSISLEIQDLALDEKYQNKLYLFYYMYGVFESVDYGKTFNYKVDTYNTLTGISSYSNSIAIIDAKDLRLNDIKSITVDGGGLSPNYTILLLPTDQGLFTYDNLSFSLNLISENIYLGDTINVSTTSCPGIYSGFWHVGQFYMKTPKNPAIIDTGEQEKVYIGEDEGCKTGVINKIGEYYIEEKTDNEKSAWINKNINLSYGGYTYNKGWWYGWGINKELGKSLLVKFNKKLTKSEIIKEIWIRDFYIENAKSESNYWLLDDLNQIWESTNLKNWEIFTNLPNQNIDNYNAKLFIKNNLITISQIEGKNPGLLISQNGGKTWETLFKNAKVSNIVEDKQQNLYVGLMPPMLEEGYSSPELWFDKDMLGVWKSTDNGQTWKPYKKGTEKSWISGLAIESTTNTLYASTRGESLLKIKLPK